MKLSYAARKSMPKKDFALPAKREGGKGGYPIEDKANARNALARVAQYGSPTEKKEVRAKVHEKYPGIGKSKNPHHGRPKLPKEILNDKHFDRIGR